ncbi:hypothetical protein C8J48_1259 [Desmospora activa DSM 45169]|uniref:Uncharacterized protein n=1 Tax=Desmospora activa DSM 45169 TaxID=1121389 RepID=A0A2T4Z9V8_9BACL|nr:hypothetical protein C8J48_1259 [Desmospora activa DSM 45169]
MNQEHEKMKRAVTMTAPIPLLIYSVDKIGSPSFSSISGE